MNDRWKSLLGFALLGSPVWAHFPFLVPTPDHGRARILLSETLEPDDRVPADLVLAGSYVARLGDGERSLAVQTTGEVPCVVLSGELAAASALFGTLDLGFTQRGDGTPHVLVYHAKTLLRDPFDPRAHRAEPVPIEITPVRAEGGLQLLLAVDGAPAPNAEMVVLMPDGEERELVTGADGTSEVLADRGRYGAWARSWIAQPGERDGKAYAELRRYATLVFDHGASPAVAAEAGRVGGHARPRSAAPLIAATELPLALPEATSSFGAVHSDGWIYVYGGHVAPTHDYDVEAVSGRFSRIDLAGSGTWEELPAGPALQGMNLAAHRGAVYRVGGMAPRNAPGERVDNWSVASVARFDPRERRWEELEPLPEPRSSHDVAVVDDMLYAIGGWNMAGAAGNTWPASMLALDLTDPSATWTELPQPFRRRALIVAVHDDKVFAIGGFDEDDEPSRRVDVFDPRAGRWSQGPGLPGDALNGFAPAACVHDGQLYVSLGDGSLHRLDDRDLRWEQVGTSTPRIVHRLVPLGGRVLLLGGASKGDNHDLMEAFAPPPSSGGSASSARAARASADERLARQLGREARSAALPQPLPERAAPRARAGTAEEAPAPAVADIAGVAGVAGVAPPPSPGALAAAAVQTHCPIMTDEAVSATSYAVEHGGRTVLLCCKSCVRKWGRDPERYAGSVHLPQLARSVASGSAALGEAP